MSLIRKERQRHTVPKCKAGSWNRRFKFKQGNNLMALYSLLIVDTSIRGEGDKGPMHSYIESNFLGLKKKYKQHSLYGNGINCVSSEA